MKTPLVQECLDTISGSRTGSTAVAEQLQWWALYTRHQHEKVVAEMLTAKNFDVFLPLYSSVRRWKDRRKVISLPLFPGYVFLRGGYGRRLEVVSTPGIHMILTHGERVATIPEEDIQAIRKTVEGNFRVEPHPFLKCGERVRVTRGPLQGVEGILTRKKNLFRLVLSVDMLAQSVGVEIDASDVEPVAARETAAVIPSLLPTDGTTLRPAQPRM
ncbi:MAG TPA: UpxY family transcription antiterminator [Acidobacteriaceae bacterium]|jgi:transcription antitermination factor NusG|nr:UpxY family transcription antiterminator [Acidobacteriaceae bacterium]